MGEASRPAPVARVDDDPVAQALAVRVVLARYADEGWTADETLDVLRALGLQPYEAGARTDALGRREVTTRARRRQKARQAATHPDVPGSPERGSTADSAGNTGPSTIEGRSVMTEPEPVARPSEILDEDDHTRRNRDAIAANAIAKALSERFGLVRFSTRYRLAHEAIDQARAEVEPIQRSLREFDALSPDEQAKAIVTTFRESGMTLDEFLKEDPE